MFFFACFLYVFFMSCNGHSHGAARASRRSFSSCWKRKPTIWSCKNWRKIWSAGATWCGHGAAMAEPERMVGRCSMLANMLTNLLTMQHNYMKHAWNMQSTARIDALTMFESHFGWKIPLGFPEMSLELRKGPTPGNNDCGRTTGTTAEAEILIKFEVFRISHVWFRMIMRYF